MKAHTSQFKQQIKNLGRQFDSIVSYGNKQLKEEIFSATPAYEGTILKSVMKQLVIETSEDIPINTTINFKIGLLVNGQYEYMDYGNYIVMTSEKEEDKNLYRLTCYDKMLRSMLPYAGIDVDFPMTVRDYITNLCVKIGLVFSNQNSSFANYNRVISSDPYIGLEYTYRDVLDELAQVTASTICINDDDQLEVRYITSTSDVIDEEYLKDVNITFAEKYGPINSIVLSRSAETDNVYLKDDESVEENGLCELKIIDNQIMNNNDRSDYLADILNKLDGLEYYINDFSSTGILYYDLCDRYGVRVGEQVYSCIMFSNEVNVTTGVEEFIYTDMPEQSQTDYTKADKTDRKINQTYLLVDKQNQKIESVINNVTQQNEKISRITQTVDEIDSKIQEISDITTSGEVRSGRLKLNDINESEPITLRIHPTVGSISYLYPTMQDDEYIREPEYKETRVYPSMLTYTSTRTLRFKRTYTQDEQTLTEDIDYELPDDLLYYDSNTYDEFYLDYDSQTCQIIKRCAYTDLFGVQPLPTEQTITYPYPEIHLNDGNYEIYLLNISGYIFARLMAKNIYTTQFATRVEVRSDINQKADEINLSVTETLQSYPTKTEMSSAISISAEEINSEVRKKVGNDEVISRINQSAEQIQISANKISLAGKFIDLTADDIAISANNFSVDRYGNMSANNANISGTITATSGTFENCTITNSCSVPASTVYGTLSTNTIPSLSAEKITSGTMSASRISGGTMYGVTMSSGTVNASSVNGLTVSGDVVSVNTRFGRYDIGNYKGYPSDGNDFKLIVQHEGNSWRRLTFRGGILVNVETNW